MFPKKFLTTIAFLAATATGASAATINVGDASDGYSNRADLSYRTLDFYNFSISDGLSSISFAASQARRRDFIDTEIGIYNSRGRRIANDDDGGRGLNSYLAFGDGSGRDMLAAGSYTLVVGSYNTIFTRNIRNLRAGRWSAGAYNVSIDTDVAAVPAPAGGLLLLTGLAGFVAARRKRKA